jgi:hypothetical protein
MMSEHAYILKTFGTILLGVILYMIIRAWVGRRKHPQQPVQQQRPSENSSDVPSSYSRYASHRHCTTGDPAEAASPTSGRTHRRTSLEEEELAALFELVRDAGLDDFFLSEMYSGINWVDESASDDRTNLHH